ncbi:TrkH family potassium uptake protein [Paroceanicella profunda]|uniref:Trk system potassium uptake protein n=1 Tax=Paroceanicella profunda TaxID=2579971 RepID=A0A5B8FX43_9RHOB|nr:TrkH family potassium uptake protein [Paroceanicella profunda]QDL91760.1 TrkH family potassium uptake protein [Paroceanicella profunda]
MSLVVEFRSALHVVAVVSLALAAIMLAPAGMGLSLGWPGANSFLVSAVMVGVVSLMVAVSTWGARRPDLTARFGFMLVNLLWWISPAVCAVPLMLGPAQLSFVDAYFESVSGMTTTGSTVMTGLDGFDHATLLWRSIVQWLGGLGMLSLGLILLPFLSVGGMQLFRMESSDRADKPLPRFVALSKVILLVYVGLTLACAGLYSLAGMSGFDAFNHAFTTLSTGGYSTHDASMGYFTGTGVLWVGTVFMIAGSLPFSLYIVLIFSRHRMGVDPQVRVFISIIVVATALLFFGRSGDDAHGLHALAQDAFNVTSVITTTGYAAGDYTVWGTLAVPLFYVLTFLGGCAGSTAGGLKTYRLIVMMELIRTSLAELLHPRGVFPMRYGNRQIAPDIFRSALVMMMAFIATLGVLTILLGACGLDFLTALTGAVTALTNVGPGLGDIIGPAGNFAPLPDTAKILLAIGMVLGRLEILGSLVLLSPLFWRT